MKQPGNPRVKVLRAGLLAGVLLFGWMTGSLLTSGDREILLDDGTELRILGPAPGPRKRVSLGPRWQHRLLPLLPEGLCRSLGWKEVQLAVPAGGPVLYVLRRYPPVGRGFPLPGTEITAAVCDSRGQEYPVRALPEYSLGPTKAIEGWQATLYGRGDRYVRFRLIGMTHSRQIASNAYAGSGFPRRSKTLDLDLPNPAPVKPAAAAMVSLPQTAKKNGLEFSLTSLVHEASRNSEYPHPVTRAAFQARQGGKRTRAWHPWDVIISDDQGNAAQAGGFESGRDRTQTLAFQDALWGDARACRMRVEFVQREGIPAAERIRLPSFPIAPRSSRSRGTTIEHPYGELVVTPIHEDLPRMPDGRERMRIEVAVRLTTPPIQPVTGEVRHSEGVHLSLLSATDRRGRSVLEPWGNSWEMNSRRMTHIFWLNVTPGTRTLELELALHRSLFVEFQAPVSYDLR